MDVSLQSVDFADGTGQCLDGLVAVSDVTQELTPDEAAVLRQAATFPEVTYVFFRRFSDGRSSQTAAFVVDNENEHLDNAALAKLHNDLWLHGVAPLVYVAWATRIDILSCARGPDFWQNDQRQYQPAVQLEIASTVEGELAKRRRFSAHRLADGTFWEDPRNHPLANHEKAAHESLIQAIVETDEALEGETKPILRRLLLLMVLIKYLEDRDVFPGPGWFGRFHKGARSFFDVLRSGEPECVLRLLRTLEERFNGDVFAIPAAMTLTKTALRRFGQLVEAKTLKQQRYLWDQFSFSHLPVEVISHLYQRFVKGSTAVYTPPFLAALLLDYAMPYQSLTGKERVLDPACGSGVFLVGAYRRLVTVYRAKHKRRPNVGTLKSILKKQIFGVETDANAIDLTAFSLALAVCDSLQPNVIWNELQFDPLRGNNLIEADFFDCSTPDEAGSDSEIGKFDIVIGNPPFESDFSVAAVRVRQKDDKPDAIPDKQIAYLFLGEGLRLLNPNGRLCLLQPSGFLYNINVGDLRQRVLTDYAVETILDFSSIRNLFEGADTKAICIVAGIGQTPIPVCHLTFRRTFSTYQKVGFELDHYDRHLVPLEQALDEAYVWKTNLLGGGRLNVLARRLSALPSVDQFVQKQEWAFAEGYISGAGKPADYLTGKPLLSPDDLKQTPDIDTATLPIVTETEFLRRRKRELFESPLVLIGETLDLPVVFWDRGPVAYRNQIVGIHADPDEASALFEFYSVLQAATAIHRFWVAATSSRAMASMATSLLKTDVESLPYPDDHSDAPVCEWESVLAEDVTTYLSAYVRLGQNSELLKDKASVRCLREYSAMFRGMLGSIYDNLQADEPVFLNGLICFPFYFGEEPALEWLGPDCEDQLRELVFDDSRESLRTIRVVRYYYENVVFIIKPDRLRYWIKSTAVRDADDTLVELQRQGY